MLDWWIRPFVRLIAALVLPFAVPGVITIALWMLPGDPAERQKLLDELGDFLDKESDKLSRLHEKCENCGKPGGT